MIKDGKYLNIVKRHWSRSEAKDDSLYTFINYLRNIMDDNKDK